MKGPSHLSSRDEVTYKLEFTHDWFLQMMKGALGPMFPYQIYSQPSESLVPGSDNTNSGRLWNDLVVADKLPVSGAISNIRTDEWTCWVTSLTNSSVPIGMLHDTLARMFCIFLPSATSPPACSVDQKDDRVLWLVCKHGECPLRVFFLSYLPDDL